MMDSDEKSLAALSAVTHANIRYHTKLAAEYNADQPQYRPENRARVRRNLQRLCERTSSERLLDVGCGTGFILDTAAEFFASIIGLDITTAMLEQVAPNPRIQLVNTDITKRFPLPDNHVDVCTAYGVLHHLEDYRPTLSEMYRTLKPGGLIYTDSDPNRDFFGQLYDFDATQSHSPIIAREVRFTTHEDDETAKRYDLDVETVRLAEFQKLEQGGMAPTEVTRVLHEVGFTEIELHHEWFLGQGSLVATNSFELAQQIDSHLRQCLPFSKNLFKYLRFEAKKPVSDMGRK